MDIDRLIENLNTAASDNPAHDQQMLLDVVKLVKKYKVSDDWRMPENALKTLTDYTMLVASLESPRALANCILVELDIAYSMGAADCRLEMLKSAKVGQKD